MLQLAKHRTLTTEPVYKFQNNHSVDFDGVDDFIQLGEPISYTQHTISAWVKIGASSDSRTIFDARDADNDGIRIYVASNNKIIYQLNTSDISSLTLTMDEWVHVVATYDGTTQKLYINSSLANSTTTSQTIDTTTNAEIGSRNFSDRANEFLGKIDELAIWDRALTAAEVTEIYRIKYGANLVQNGRFDELGSELVTNGDFAISGEILSTTYNLGWVKFSSDAGNFISDGVLHLVHQDTGGFNGRVQLSNGVNGTFAYSGAGESYKLVYEIKENSSNSNLFVWNGSSYLSLTNTVGSHTFYYASTSGTQLGLFLRNGTNDSTIKLDNISVKQVDPNDRFTLGTGFSFGDSKIIADAATGNLLQTNVFTIGKTYKITFTINEVTAGNGVRVLCGTTNGTVRTTAGTYSQILTCAGSAHLFVDPNISFTGSISNLMAEEQKYVASNLKLNSGNYKSADPVIVSTKSVDLDGGEEYLEVQDDASLRGLSNLSISTWVKLSSKGAFDKIIDYSGAEGNVNRKYRLMLNTDANRFQFLIGDASDTVYTVTSTTDPDLNRWYNVICTFQGSGSNRLKIYVNGVLEASGSGADSVAEISNTADGNLRFGSNSYSVANLFHGKLDELGIFNTALTSDQVGELYNQGVPSNLATSSAGVDGTLIGYWKMGDGTLDEAPLIADQTNATLGSDVITNGDFNGNADSWELFNAEYQPSGNNVKLTKPSSGNSVIFQTGLSFEEGQILRYKFKFVSFTGSPFIRIDGFSGSNPLNTSTSFAASGGDVDTYIKTDRAGTGVFLYIVGGSIGDTVVIDDISVQIVQGNPALMQNTPTIVTDAPLTKIRNYYRMGDGILDKFPYINDMISPNLAEITSTNLVTHSTDLDSSFAKNNVTIESNAIISPDGTQNASYVKATSSTSVHLISDVMGTNDVIAMSIHAKQGGYTRFRFNSGSSGNGFASFNIATGTVVSTGGTYFYNADIEDVGDGWFRCKMVLIGSPGTGMTVAIEDDAGQVNYTGDTSKGIYFWGAQGEVQRQVTPLITTTGSTVTRTATIENNYGSMINMSESDITNDVPS